MGSTPRSELPARVIDVGGPPDDRWWRGLDVQLAGYLPSGGRVLDVGCGGGQLVDRLRATGFDAVGVDPKAPERPGLVRGLVEELPGEAEYDAACAVMSLHHAALEPVCAAIVRLLRPGGALLVSELSWDEYDHRAARWVDRHDGSGKDTTVEAWGREHAGLHTGDTVRAAVADVFEIELTRHTPYLSRMVGRPDLEANETALVERSSLPPLGFELHCRGSSWRR